MPRLTVETNGGILSLDDAQRHLRQVDGVMIGRAAYENMWMLAAADQRLYGAVEPSPTRREVIDAVLPYAEEVTSEGEFLSRVTRHLVNLLRGVPGARAWRRHLSEKAHRPGAGVEVVLDAMRLVPDSVLDDRPTVLAVAS